MSLYALCIRCNRAAGLINKNGENVCQSCWRPSDLASSPTPAPQLQKFYVSLTGELVGTYMEYSAESENVLRQHLANVYLNKDGSWKLPWCAIYKRGDIVETGNTTIIKAKCGPVTWED